METHRALAVLKLATTVPGLIKQLHAIILAMTGNVWFPNPNPTLSKVSAAVGALETAEANLKSPGGTTARNTQKRAVKTEAQQLLSFVQGIADANPAQAEQIITSANMLVKRSSPRQKNTIQAKQGSVSGLVMLIAALAGQSAYYMWEWSTDQKTWTSLPKASKTRTSVNGLTPATMYYFRYKSLSRAGESDWSQVVSLLVK